jgi:uncharacterized protein (TIRG00374 family)
MSEAAGGAEQVNPTAPEQEDERDEQPALQLTPRSVLGLAVFLGLSLAALYFILPQLAGLDDTWARIERGRPAWIAAALLLSAGMFIGYVGLFRGVYAGVSDRIDWSVSYQITLAGLAASRLFSAGGAGGLVLTAWALRRAGVARRMVADKTMAFLVLTYFPYVLATVVCGFGLHWGLFRGEDPFAFTFVPAVFGVIAMAICLALAIVPTDLHSRVEPFAARKGRVGRLAQQLAQAPAATSAGVREAMRHLRTRDPALLGAVLFWAFQIAVLWAAFQAFGDPPPVAVLTQAFFVGMLGNLLPMPGGVGGVEGGMIAALAAFGVPAGLAVVAVLVYRAFAFWLPMIPGVIAFLQLRRTVERWKRPRPGPPVAAQLHYTN